MAVVEYVEACVRVVDCGGSDERFLKDLTGLGINRNQNVDRGRESFRHRGQSARCPSPADADLDREEEHCRKGIEFCKPKRQTDEGSSGFHEVKRIEQTPVQIPHTESDSAQKKSQLEYRVPARHQKEEQGDSEEFPGNVGRETDKVERPQESQKLVVVPSLLKRDGPIKPEPVMQVVGQRSGCQRVGVKRCQFDFAE